MHNCMQISECFAKKQLGYSSFIDVNIRQQTYTFNEKIFKRRLFVYFILIISQYNNYNIIIYSKRPDIHLNKWSTIINIKWIHNHRLINAEMKNPVLNKTKASIMDLFNKGIY